VDVPGCLLRKRRDSIFCDKAEAARGNNVPSDGSRFALGGGPFADGRLLFRGYGLLERLFEERLGEKSERLDSDLNKSSKDVGVNSLKEFIHTSNCNLDLRESRKNNHKESNFI